MTKYKAIKYRIYPNTAQILLLAQMFGCARKVYNEFLAIQNAKYKSGEKHMSRTAMNNYCNQVLKDALPYLRAVDKFALTNSIYHLADAFDRFFTGEAGYPNFKSKRNCRDSYTTNWTNNNIAIVEKGVRLPKLGIIYAKIHRTAPNDWKLKSATVSKAPSGKYYISVLYEYENQVSEVAPEHILGLDYSSPYLYIDSDGNEPDYEKPYRKYHDRLAKEQRKLSEMALKAKASGRSLKDCRNYQKQKRRVARIHEKIANCRKDALHKLSRSLADQYDAIAVEDLNMRAMSQGLNLGKATLDNGYGMFVAFLKYKLEDRGKQLIVIDRWYPSTKTCSCCGSMKPMRLSDREYVCPECGLVTGRDVNAAINIRDEALRMLKAA